MLANFHSVGTVPVCKDTLNRSVREGEICSAHSTKTFAAILSGPGALLLSMVFIAARTSAESRDICGRDGIGLEE